MNVHHPVDILKKFTDYFYDSIKQKKLKVDIDEQLYGSMVDLNMLKPYGVKMDVDLYQQILYNVFVNACKYSREEGEVKLRVSIMRDHRA